MSYNQHCLVTIRTWADRQVDTTIADVISGRDYLSDEDRRPNCWSARRKISSELLDFLPESSIDPSSSEEEEKVLPSPLRRNGNDQPGKRDPHRPSEIEDSLKMDIEKEICLHCVIGHEKKETGEFCTKYQASLTQSPDSKSYGNEKDDKEPEDIKNIEDENEQTYIARQYAEIAKDPHPDHSFQQQQYPKTRTPQTDFYYCNEIQVDPHKNYGSYHIENSVAKTKFDGMNKNLDKRLSSPEKLYSLQYLPEVRKQMPNKQTTQLSYDAEALAVMEQFDKSLEESEEDVSYKEKLHYHINQSKLFMVEKSQKNNLIEETYFSNSQTLPFNGKRFEHPYKNFNKIFSRDRKNCVNFNDKVVDQNEAVHGKSNRQGNGTSENVVTTRIVGVKFHEKTNCKNREKQKIFSSPVSSTRNSSNDNSPRNIFNKDEICKPYREMAVDVGDLENISAERKKEKIWCNSQEEKKCNLKIRTKENVQVKNRKKKEEKYPDQIPKINQKHINGVSSTEKLESAPSPAQVDSGKDSEIGQPSISALDGAVIGAECNLSDPRAAIYHQGHFVVVAIDFGTTFSGYAFSFTRDPENIHMMRKWEGGDPGVINQKTPTCLLLTPEGKFHSFGYSARDNYHDLDSQSAKHWLYFDKFKMTLHHNVNLSRETVISATNGQTLPALVVFAHALNYFKNHALMELCDQSATEILNEDVRWVITVPAIWRQPAKQFMRQAAYEAGIATPEYPDQLLIALEPEAASIYCRKLRMNQLVPEGPELPRFSLIPQPPPVENPIPAIEDINQGTCYIVVDCGGGTVDITVHEMLDKSGSLKELYKATGGPYGSVGVDKEFEQLLNEIFGTDFMNDFKRKHPTAYIDLMIAFEARKRNASPFKETPLNISLPFSFIDYYRKCKGSVESSIKKYGVKGIQWSSQGMLRLSPETMYRLFKPTVENILKHIQTVISNITNHKLSYLFLVGGFAESQILQQEIRQNFGSPMRVIIPQGVSLAILRGAVLYGLDPTIVCIRRSRMTYGVGVLNRFIPGIHPRNKCITRDGQDWCADIFDKFVLTDQSVGLGDTILRSYTPANSQQKQIILNIYCSENEQAKFVTDPGVRHCGTLRLDISEANKSNVSVPNRREIQIRMIFGDTEIKISALDVVTQKFVKAEIDFLNL